MLGVASPFTGMVLLRFRRSFLPCLGLSLSPLSLRDPRVVMGSENGRGIATCGEGNRAIAMGVLTGVLGALHGSGEAGIGTTRTGEILVVNLLD